MTVKAVVLISSRPDLVYAYTPNLYRLHVLSLAYDCKLDMLLRLYGTR
jgi:hypothetical protein